MDTDIVMTSSPVLLSVAEVSGARYLKSGNLGSRCFIVKANCRGRNGVAVVVMEGGQRRGSAASKV
jgi:hypothetical protein